MHKTIYKYSVVASIFVFSLLSFSSLAIAVEYGALPYSEGTYSTYTPSSGGSTGTTQEFRDKFLAEQQALATAAQEGDTVVPPTTPVTSGGSSLNITRTLKLGMTGEDVKTLQTYLNANGYDCGTPDGAFGPKTKAAVILFQKAKGLDADGIVGPMTVAAMSNSTTPSTSVVTTPTTPTTSGDSSLNITRTLKLGMTGEDVKTLQTYLNANGYDCGTPDGSFGPKTKAAVILFQKAKGLDADGIVGPMTIAQLK